MVVFVVTDVTDDEVVASGPDCPVRRLEDGLGWIQKWAVSVVSLV